MNNCWTGSISEFSSSSGSDIAFSFRLTASSRTKVSDGGSILSDGAGVGSENMEGRLGGFGSAFSCIGERAGRCIGFEERQTGRGLVFCRLRLGSSLGIRFSLPPAAKSTVRLIFREEVIPGQADTLISLLSELDVRLYTSEGFCAAALLERDFVEGVVELDTSRKGIKGRRL